ncbi:rRNA maturation RNase YbeY [Bacillus marinisedimentorum]|uniref:rRNA maturation RNase YbeY n=1 Tax=Bacillus marinisedimentorum TaxID=1821260 RepID=UPI0008727E5B|nr:rRNA maturation RNase YbeY [Bacillus marinisedimentorum]
MTLTIDFADETGNVKEEHIAELEKLLNKAAEVENVKDEAELSVTFVDNDVIQQINRDYRGKDSPTDVISFAMEEMGQDEMEIHGEGLPYVLGDIIISIPKTIEQAESYGHSFMRELGFLTVHGFLHLLGYDHMAHEDEKVMFEKQKEILEAYGLTR